MRFSTRSDDFDLARGHARAGRGVFAPAREHRREADFRDLFAVTIDVPLPDGTMPDGGRVVSAAGGAPTRARAAMSAFGESIERLGLYSYSPADVRWDAFSRLGDLAVDPARCVHYTDAVYTRPHLGVAPYRPSATGAWYPAYNLTQRREQLVPAVLAFNELTPGFPVEARWDRPVSTGGACHADAERAMLTGLYEVIERDALMIHWENRLAGLVRPLPPDAAAMARWIEGKGFSVHVVELPTDLGVSVALAVVVDDVGGRAAMGTGAAARATWASSASRALEEAIQTVQWIATRRLLQGEGLDQIEASLASIPRPVVHAEYYGFAEKVPHAAFLWTGTRGLCDAATDHTVPTFPSIADELAWLRARVEARGFEVLAADITPIEGAEAGLCVVRVIVPGLVPLSRGRFLRPERAERLRRVPAFFARPELHLPGGNPEPHPLP